MKVQNGRKKDEVDASFKRKEKKRPPDERLTVENSELVLKPDFFSS